MYDDLLDMPLSKRLDHEANYMNAIQNEKTDQRRYYALDNDWI